MRSYFGSVCSAVDGSKQVKSGVFCSATTVNDR